MSEASLDSLFEPISVRTPCAETARNARQVLARVGLRVLETFNLQDARLGSPGYPCPNHGTRKCDCQFVVLLIYGEATAPVALTLHGNDGCTWISLAHEAQSGADMTLRMVIEQTLAGMLGKQGL